MAGEFFTTSATWEARKRGRLKFNSENLRLHPGLATSLVAHIVKNLPAMQEMWVQSLGQADTLEKEMVTHSSILTQRIPWTKEPDALQFMGSQKLRGQ